MKTMSHIPFILEERPGRRWYFYLSPAQRIMYTIKNNDQWSAPASLDKEIIKQFSATIDRHGNIYVIAYSLSRQLIFYEWNGIQWQYKILHRIHSRFQQISFLSLVATRRAVHIFYYLESSLRKSAESLYHYYLYKKAWKGGLLWSFLSDEHVNPQSIFADSKDNIHFTYTMNKHKKSKMFYTFFDGHSMNWDTPKIIHENNLEYFDCSMFITAGKLINIIWKEKDDEKNRIYYLQKRTDSASESDWLPVKLLYESIDEIEHPVFLCMENLYSFFKIKNKVHYMVSKDEGISWSEIKTLQYTVEDKAMFFAFTTFVNDEWPPTLGIWGLDYPNISLFPVDLPFENNESGNSDKYKEHQTQLYKQLHQLSEQINDIYSFLYSIQERIKQKEKVIYQLELSMKRLSFNLEQMRVKLQNTSSRHLPSQGLPSTFPEKKVPVDVSIYESKDLTPEEKDPALESSSSQKIVLGNTSIIINPDNEDENLL